MTKNQIELSKLLETRRANRAGETISQQRADEEIRSHKANEDLTRSAQTEARRHNLASESLGRKQQQEVERHNVVTEGETSRHNKATELAAAASLDAQREYNVGLLGIRQSEVEVKRDEVAEKKRSNLVQEQLQSSYQQQTLDARRKELEQNLLYQTQQNALRAAELEERVRAAKASEQLTSQQISASVGNSQRAASAQMYGAQLSAAASRYASDTSAQNVQAQNAVRREELGQTRVRDTLNYALGRQRNVETKRHNEASETLTSTSIGVQREGNYLHTAGDILSAGTRILTSVITNGGL